MALRSAFSSQGKNVMMDLRTFIDDQYLRNKFPMTFKTPIDLQDFLKDFDDAYDNLKACKTSLKSQVLQLTEELEINKGKFDNLLKREKTILEELERLKGAVNEDKSL